MVFQSYALFPHLSVLDNVAYGLKLRKVATAERRQRAQALLDTVGAGRVCAARRRAALGRAAAARGAGARARDRPARCCSTNRCRRSTPACAATCATRSARSGSASAQPPCWSRTTRKRRSPWPTAWRCSRTAGCCRSPRRARSTRAARESRAVAEFVGLSTILPAKVAGLNKLDLGFAQLAAPTGMRAHRHRAARAGAARAHRARSRARHAEPHRGPQRRAALPGLAHALRLPRCRARPVPFLAESARPATEAIAIAPEHLRLLDH